ncbi:MAG: ABC transporter permease [Solirubrobacteraceae bacterium]
MTSTIVLSGRLEPRARRSLRWRALLPPLAFALVVLGAWQLYVAVSGISEAVLPSPLEVARALLDNRSTLAAGGWTTLSEVLLGYGVAIAFGAAIALAVSLSRLAERAVYPSALVVVWTGFGIGSKVVVIALVSFFPIAVNAIDGLRASDPALLEALATLGAGRTAQLRLARAPAALPYLFSGLRVAGVLSVIGAVFAEWVGSSSGLGYLILEYNSQGGVATAPEFAAIVVLAAIGIVLFAAVSIVERLALPWYRTDG